MNNKYITIVSCTKNVIGCAPDDIDHAGTARTVHTHESQYNVHVSLSSLLGSIHAFRKVGKAPIKLVTASKKIDHVGLIRIKRIPATVAIKQNLSRFVHPDLPYLNDRNTTIQITRTVPII